MCRCVQQIVCQAQPQGVEDASKLKNEKVVGQSNIVSAPSTAKAASGGKSVAKMVRF